MPSKFVKFDEEFILQRMSNDVMLRYNLQMEVGIELMVVMVKVKTDVCRRGRSRSLRLM